MSVQVWLSERNLQIVDVFYFCPFCHASAYMEIVFFIKGDIGVYINNGSLTIYIFIDIHIYYRSHDVDNIYFFLWTADKKDNNLF